MVTTATRARTNSSGDKSTLRGGAGKGGGGRLIMVGALSIAGESGIAAAYAFEFIFFLPLWFFFRSLELEMKTLASANGGVLWNF